MQPQLFDYSSKELYFTWIMVVLDEIFNLTYGSIHMLQETMTNCTLNYRRGIYLVLVMELNVVLLMNKPIPIFNE